MTNNWNPNLLTNLCREKISNIIEAQVRVYSLPSKGLDLQNQKKNQIRPTHDTVFRPKVWKTEKQKFKGKY